MEGKRGEGVSMRKAENTEHGDKGFYDGTIFYFSLSENSISVCGHKTLL